MVDIAEVLVRAVADALDAASEMRGQQNQPRLNLANPLHTPVLRWFLVP